MAWKDVKLRRKFIVGFGVVIVLLIAVAAWSYLGITNIVNNAEEVITGNKLRGNIVQREVDHLNWTVDLNKLLNDDSVNELLVETDPTQCAFGKWYYSDARRQAERQIPELRPLLEEIEAPHRRLHESAVQVGEQYVRVDEQLGDFLREKKVDHLAWAHRVKDVFVDLELNRFRNVELDHTQCSLGQYLYSDHVEEKRQTSSGFDQAITPIYQPHKQLHQSAQTIAEAMAEGRKEEMRSYYMNNTKPLAYETLDAIDQLISWHDQKLAAREKASDTYAQETTASLSEVQQLLGEIVTTTEENVMTDEAMLAAAQTTQRAVILISVISILLGVILAVIIARGILLPLQKGVRIASEVSAGDLSVEIDVDQRDEIGQLANAMNEMITAMRAKARVAERIAAGDLTSDVRLASERDELGKSLQQMNESLNDLLGQVSDAVEQVRSGADQVSQASQSLSQGATEQASSLEEVSSSVNQINSQSKQNAENAQQANQLSDQASESAGEGNNRMNELMELMDTINASSDEINKVVKIIDDISFQINLLALNANVEAARAGSYGKGFAVVADEVRNLANKSADSVSETNRMVEDTVNNIQKGAEAARSTADQLNEIVESSRKVSEILEELSRSNREQSQAIDQITEALEQIDQVTQSNTASAEESASAAEELSGQAQQLESMVRSFTLKRERGGGSSGPRALTSGAGTGSAGASSSAAHTGNGTASPEETGITPAGNASRSSGETSFR
jgi:methyl-accepting chemotaxis protein